MDEKLIRMLIEYKDEFERAPDNLSVGACAALLDLCIRRLAGWGFDEPGAIGILSAIFSLREAASPAQPATLKQLHMTAAFARRTERAKPSVPAAA